MSIYPWQQKQWEIFVNNLQNDKIAHAYLLTAVPGMGKKDFASTISKALLCSNRQLLEYSEVACGQCQSCLLFEASTHPDHQVVTLLEKSKSIKISQVRELNDFVQKTPQIASYKTIIINPSESMSQAAANALLKTLEEPAKNTVIILISSEPGQLLPTVRSRCQMIHFPSPSRQQAQDWLVSQLSNHYDDKVLLGLSQGAPLQALALASSQEFEQRSEWFEQWLNWQQTKLSFSQLVTSWEQYDLSVVLYHVLTWLHDLLKLIITRTKQKDFLLNPDFACDLQDLTAKVEPWYLGEYIQYVQTQRSLVLSQISVNQRSILETVLIKWIALYRQSNLNKG